MKGAIIGDVIGSLYEFNNAHSLDFKLYDERMTFTDDTVLTVATMTILLNNYEDNVTMIEKTYKEYGNKYAVNYGFLFQEWLKSPNGFKYQSYGNGGAMRISPLAYKALDLNDLKNKCYNLTHLTHGSEDGLKGAYVLAKTLYLILNKKTKEEIKTEVLKDYSLTYNLEELIKNNPFSSKAIDTIPLAIYVFLISDSFVDNLKKAIMVGGDSDTICSMSLALGEAYYGLDRKLWEFVKHKLPTAFIEIIDKFYNCYVKRDFL